MGVIEIFFNARNGSGSGPFHSWPLPKTTRMDAKYLTRALSLKVPIGTFIVAVASFVLKTVLNLGPPLKPAPVSAPVWLPLFWARQFMMFVVMEWYLFFLLAPLLLLVFHWPYIHAWNSRARRLSLQGGIGEERQSTPEGIWPPPRDPNPT